MFIFSESRKLESLGYGYRVHLSWKFDMTWFIFELMICPNSKTMLWIFLGHSFVPWIHSLSLWYRNCTQFWGPSDNIGGSRASKLSSGLESNPSPKDFTLTRFHSILLDHINKELEPLCSDQYWTLQLLLWLNNLHFSK